MAPTRNARIRSPRQQFGVRRTRPTNALATQVDPNRSLGVRSGSLKRFSLCILTRRARFERGFDEHPWAFGNDGERFI
jgi:hypothetical protein